jgi:hypothetical protein
MRLIIKMRQAVTRAQLLAEEADRRLAKAEAILDRIEGFDWRLQQHKKTRSGPNERAFS